MEYEGHLQDYLYKKVYSEVPNSRLRNSHTMILCKSGVT